VLDGLVPNLLLPLLIGTMCVLVAAVLLRAGTASFGKRVVAGAGVVPAGNVAAGSSLAQTSRSVTGASRAGPGLISAQVAQEVPSRFVAALRNSGVQPPELSSLAAVFPGALRPSVSPAFGRVTRSGAQPSNPVWRVLAPPGGNTAR